MTEPAGPSPDGLIAWRKRMKLTRRAAARALGCSRGAWGRWESGAVPIPLYVGLALQALSQQAAEAAAATTDPSPDTQKDDDDGTT